MVVFSSMAEAKIISATTEQRYNIAELCINEAAVAKM